MKITKWQEVINESSDMPSVQWSRTGIRWFL